MARLRRRFVISTALGVVWLLAAAQAASAASLAMSWTDNASDEDGFTVERRDGAGGAFQVIATLGANVTGYIDASVFPGGAYCYRVRAFNLAGPSAYTNEACGTASGTMPAPLSVALDKPSYRSGETMVATVQVVGGILPQAVDAYIVVQAGGVLLSLQANGSLVPGLVPIARNVVLPTISAPFVFPLVGAPAGSYAWLTGVTSPGTLTLVSPITTTPFTITP